MIVFIRLAFAILRALFKPPIDPLGQSVITMRVWPNDLDLNMHMTSGRYVSMIDIGRVEFFARIRLLRKAFKRGWRPVVGATTIRYRRSLLPFERFTVHTRILCWDEKWFYFRHVIERDGDMAAIAYVRGLLRGKEGNVAPAALLALAGREDLVSPPPPEDLAKWLAVEIR